MTKSPATRHFLAEVYLPREQGAGELALVLKRARRGALDAGGDGASVRYVSSTYIPEEELLFVLYGSDSLTAVESALKRAGLAHERVHEDVALEVANSTSFVRQPRKETKWHPTRNDAF